MLGYCKYTVTNLLVVSGCEDPPTPLSYTLTNPPYYSGQFVIGDTIEYSCNGYLIPNITTTLTCSDNGTWFPEVTFFTCSKN